MNVAALTCPACGAPVRVSAAGRSLSVLCSGCGATLDALSPALRQLAKAAETLAVPEIPLGSRAEIDGITWEVVGYLERQRVDTGEGWREYLLFNPWEAYLWLIDDGQFWLGSPVTDTPDAAGRRAILARQDWHGIRRYDARVRLAVGEFPWRVTAGERVAVREYQHGTRLLSCEQTGEEESWTLITPQPAGRIEALFGLERRAAVATEWPPLRTLWPLHLGMGMAAMIAVLIIDLAAPAERHLVATNLLVQVDGPTTTASLGPVEVPDGRHRIAITALPNGYGLDNQWIDLDYELVDRRTQTSYPVSGVAEYYRGRDSDGPWTEGDERPLTTMASIPGGTYDLVIEASGHSWLPPGQTSPDSMAPRDQVYSIAVSRDGSFGDNLWLAGLALLLWPLGLAWYAAEHRDEEDDW